MFCNEILILGSTLIRVKKVNAKWRIRLKFIQSFHPPNPNKSKINRKKTHWIVWRRPQDGFIKINCDGFKTSERAAGRFILHNWEGRFVRASAFYLKTVSVLVAEATTMRDGIKDAIQAGFTDIHIEGDNRTLIQAVRGRIQTPWEIQVLVQDIYTYIQLCNNIRITHIFRQENSAAD